MPPKKTKDPAEPSSGEGAALTPSPEPELADATGDVGVRPIGDPGVLRTVSEFRAAIGIEKPPPTPEKTEAWRLGLEQLDLLQLQNLALELALSPASVLEIICTIVQMIFQCLQLWADPLRNSTCPWARYELQMTLMPYEGTFNDFNDRAVQVSRSTFLTASSCLALLCRY